MLSEDFKEGYSDGYGQAVANVEAVLRKYVEAHSTVIDFVEIRENAPVDFELVKRIFSI